MTIHRISRHATSFADGARPAVRWAAVVVVLAAAWLSGNRPAAAQTRAASKPSVVQEDAADPAPWQSQNWPLVMERENRVSRRVVENNSRQRPMPHPPRQGPAIVRPVVEDNLPEWQTPGYSPQRTGSARSVAQQNLPEWEVLGALPEGEEIVLPYVDNNVPAWQMAPSPDQYEPDPWYAPGGRLWGRAEFLLLWGKGADLPALATTSPIGTAQAQAGVLGAQGTTLLYGDQMVNSSTRAGARFTVGWWHSPSQKFGFEATYFTAGSASAGFHASDQTNPILAQPFINAQTGAQDSSLVAYPGLETGTLDVRLKNQFYMLGGLFRAALVREPKYRLDGLFGFRYARFTEDINVNSQSTSISATGAVPVGTATSISDFFGGSNNFYGADFGIATQSRRGRLSVDLLCKIALGYSQSSVLVQGVTTTTLPSQASSIASGGLLALPTNIGRHQLGGFGVLPELGVTFEYRFTRRLSATFGYTVVYWSRVARPANQVDLHINPSQFPPGQLTGPASPQFQSVITDFWLQGITTGLKYQF